MLLQIGGVNAWTSYKLHGSHHHDILLLLDNSYHLTHFLLCDYVYALRIFRSQKAITTLNTYGIDGH
jgi:hypothetical protein